MEPYNVILADPPWPYNQRSNPASRFGLGVHGHYQTMTVKEIAELAVAPIAHPTASVLFLWTTFPHLQSGLHVIEKWKFTYKTVGFVWVKLNSKRARIGRQGLAEKAYGKGVRALLRWLTFFGTGFYTKSNPELCLLATKGKVLHPRTDAIPNLVFAARSDHSAKPVVVNERIVELFGQDKRYVELFARRSCPGWDAVGDDVDGLDIRHRLKEIAEAIE